MGRRWGNPIIQATRELLQEIVDVLTEELGLRKIRLEVLSSRKYREIERALIETYGFVGSLMFNVKRHSILIPADELETIAALAGVYDLSRIDIEKLEKAPVEETVRELLRLAGEQAKRLYSLFSGESLNVLKRILARAILSSAVGEDVLRLLAGAEKLLTEEKSREAENLVLATIYRLNELLSNNRFKLETLFSTVFFTRLNPTTLEPVLLTTIVLYSSRRDRKIIEEFARRLVKMMLDMEIDGKTVREHIREIVTEKQDKVQKLIEKFEQAAKKIVEEH